jgi:hypothetical protein
MSRKYYGAVYHERNVTCVGLHSKQLQLGGIVAIVLAIGSKVRGFKPGRGQWKIEILSATSFIGKVKPSVPCRKILRCVKYPCAV